MKIINKEEWLNDMPKLIYNLKLNYNFYFSGFYTKIKKDTSSSRISYFMKKFRKSYEKAEVEYESNEESNSRRV